MLYFLLNYRLFDEEFTGVNLARTIKCEYRGLKITASEPILRAMYLANERTMNASGLPPCILCNKSYAFCGVVLHVL